MISMGKTHLSKPSEIKYKLEKSERFRAKPPNIYSI
jgi:hypothetical protein